ncbi:T9SS C-terminal target domain-containing protein [Paraflavitalea soli]|uniref:T9SS C-terminal target domain-containing protein n=1 Tax=Paraflavitalea soli TaxID=2315862 RepID=A0A3B7MTH5_9BACT|nr:MBG domain-containing protein [Paraflavitalea soli]AXY76360.1 T9SS C-terminal target domain-containing protein [Paraflavitalea soli]
MIKPVPAFLLEQFSKIKVKTFVTAVSMMAICAANAHPAPTFHKKHTVTTRATAGPVVVSGARAYKVPNDIEVSDIAPAYGTLSRLWTDQNQITVTIKNNGTQDATDISVELTVTGANAENLTQVVNFLAAGTSTTLNFTASVTATGAQTIEVKVPDDDDNSNNVKQHAQDITCNTYGYTASEPIYDGFGFGSGTGIVSARYQAPGIPIQVKGVTVHLSNDPSNVGKSITGVLLDDVGNIIADSEPFYATAGDLNTTVQLVFYSPATLSPNAEFYAGVRQDEGDQAPVGTALPAVTPANRYFTFPAGGGAATHYTTLGSLKIGVMADVDATLTSSAPGQIIAGSPVTFTASVDFPDYTFKVNGITVQSSFNNVYTYFPTNNDEVYVEINSNGCTSAPIGNFAMDVKEIYPGNGIIYVNKNNPTPGDGSSWAKSLTEVADALRWAKVKEAAWTVNGPLQIWVAGGTYKPLYNTADDSFGNVDNIYNSFLLVKDVKVYGGFAGTETSLAERDLSLTVHKSILSGDFNNDDVITGSGIDLSISGTLENANHIVIASGPMGDAVLDGFTISGGGGDAEVLSNIMVNGNEITRLGGGGIHNYLASPTYSNLIIKANRSSFQGGGVYNDQSSPVYTNVLLIDNLSEFQGGGMHNANMSAPILTNVTISNNNASVEGGGLVNSSSTPVIRNSIVYGNSTGIVNENSFPSVMYSLVEGMPEDVDNSNLDGSLDPQFNNAATGNYTLKTGSPAINAGSFLYFLAGQSPDLSGITTDLGGRPRISGSTPDLGAFESSNQDQSITAEDINSTYGDADLTLAAVASSGLPVSYSLPANDIVELYQDTQDNDKWKIKIKKAGAVTLTISQGGDATYDPAENVEILLLVNRKELIVTADNKTRGYGENNPAFTISYAGFVGTDNAQSIVPPTIVTTATPASVPGDYPIILKDGDATNYDFKFVHGTLTIEGATITVLQQPAGQTVCAGSPATFTADASTTISVPVTYQWQQSADSSSWNNIAGATKAQLTTTAVSDQYYRCVFTAPGRTLNTFAAKLSVKPLEKPVINLPNSVCLSEAKFALSASLPGGVFSGVGVTGSTWYIDTLKPGLQTIQYAYTNNIGCSITVSKTTSLSLCGEKGLVTATKANPNPTTGLITVKVLLTDNVKQSIIVSNSFGQHVFEKQAQFRKGWNQVQLDLAGYSAGIYFITIAGYGGAPATVIRVMKN